MIIDVLVTSSSRFQEFKRTIKSFLTNVENKDGYRFFLHEDVRDVDGSQRILDWVAGGMFETVITSDPFGGRATGLKKLLELVESTYFIYLEQDWEFIKPINLDVFRDFLRRSWSRNQIAFSNYRYAVKPTWKALDFEGYDLVVSKFWYMSPALWRKAFAVKRHTYFTTPDSGKSFTQAASNEIGKFKIGAYALGKPDEYIKHIGPENKTDEKYL